MPPAIAPNSNNSRRESDRADSTSVWPCSPHRKLLFILLASHSHGGSTAERVVAVVAVGMEQRGYSDLGIYLHILHWIGIGRRTCPGRLAIGVRAKLLYRDTRRVQWRRHIHINDVGLFSEGNI